MKTSCKKTIQLAVATVLLSTQSCTDDPIVSPQADLTKPLTFTASVVNGVNTDYDPYANEYQTFKAERIPDGLYLMTQTSDKFYNNPLRRIAYTTTTTDSRGKQTTTTNFTESYISVCAYKFDSGTDFETALNAQNNSYNIEPYIEDLNLKVGKQTTTDSKLPLTAEQQHYWPEGECKMKFFAVSPSPTYYQPNEIGDDLFEWNYGEYYPTFTTQIDLECEEEQDYLFASLEQSSSSTSISLQMSHITTAVAVAADNGIVQADETITAVTIENIYTRGTYDPQTGTWGNLSNKQTVTFKTPELNADETKYISMKEHEVYFFMIPQTLPSDAQISITIKNTTDGSTHDIKGKIGNAETSTDDSSSNGNETSSTKTEIRKWNASQQVTYTLNNKGEVTTHIIQVEETSPQGVEPTSNLFSDLNGDGVKDYNDNYVMYYSYDGTPAGDGDKYVYSYDDGTTASTSTDTSSENSGSSGAKRFGIKALSKSKNSSPKRIPQNQTISDIGVLRVLSIKKVWVGEENKSTYKTEDVDFDVEELKYDSSSKTFSVKDKNDEKFIKGSPTAESAEGEFDYIGIKANMRTKIILKEQNATEKNSEDVTKLNNNAANSFHLENTKSGSSWVYELGNSSGPDKYKKYIDLSKYSQTLDNNNKATKWSDGRNFSNCYVINYPGYYKIPVVYGNYMVGGSTVTSSYSMTLSAMNNTRGESTKTDEKYGYGLPTLVSYRDFAVNSNSNFNGWIIYKCGDSDDYTFYPKNDSANGDQNEVDTYILWQDSKDVVKVEPYTEKIEGSFWKSTSDEFYINFSVGMDGSPFKPCNAVIYVINKNDIILWSYHIWVTSYNPYDTTTTTITTNNTTTTTNNNNNIFTADSNVRSNELSTTSYSGTPQQTFLKVPLGFQQENYIVYDARNVYVRIKQTGSGKYASIIEEKAYGKLSEGATVPTDETNEFGVSKKYYFEETNTDVIMERTTSVQIITLAQKYHEKRPISCCYYQWGRKDPFPGASMIEKSHLYYDGSYKVEYTPKTVYDNSGSATTFKKTPGEGGSDECTIGWGIQHPFNFVTGHRFPTHYRYSTNSYFSPNAQYFNLWGCTINQISDIANPKFDYPEVAGRSSNKTIYDPCPKGYKVPAILNFPAVTFDGKNHTSEYSPLIEVEGTQNEATIYNLWANTPFTTHNDFAEHSAYVFYCKHMTQEKDKTTSELYGKRDDSEGTFMIYGFGQIGMDGNFNGVGKQGYYWSSTRWNSAASSVYNQRYDYFNVGFSGTGSTFGPCSANTENYGLPILPMKY